MLRGMAAPISVSPARLRAMPVEVLGPDPTTGKPVVRQRFSVQAYNANDARNRALERVAGPKATAMIGQAGGTEKVVVYLAGVGAVPTGGASR